MFILMCIIMGLLAVVLTVTLFNVLTAPMLKKAGECRGHPRVSVLIPARNEEDNIGDCLEALLSQNYHNFEIYVLDDQSTDRTGAIIDKFDEQYTQVQAVRGKPLPVGWLGKIGRVINSASMQMVKYSFSLMRITVQHRTRL